MSEDRITNLERRVTELEMLLKIGARSGKKCKKCGSANLVFLSSVPHPHFGPLGDTTDTYRCLECGLELNILQKNKGD